MSCHLPICLQLGLNSISSSARKEKSRGLLGPRKTKKGDVNRNGLERNRENLEKLWSWKKKSRRCSLNTEKGSGGVYVRSTGKRNAELEQIPSLGSDTFAKLLQSASLFHRLGASPHMAAWLWSTLLVYNPDLGSHRERNKAPMKSQPIPVLRLPQICPINTTQPHVQVSTWQKEGMLLQLTSFKPPLCNNPGAYFNRDYYSINERKGPLNYVASCQDVLQPPAVMLKEI